MGKKEFDKFITDVGRKLADDGLLIRAGWVGFREQVIPKDAPKIQIDEMEMAFMAGALHLFSSIMNVLDEDAGPTDADLHKMSMIADELQRFQDEYVAKHITTEGNG